MFSDGFPLDVSAYIYGLCCMRDLKAMFTFSLVNQKTKQIASKDLSEIGKNYEKLSGFRGNYVTKANWFAGHDSEAFSRILYRVLFNEKSFELEKIKKVKTSQEDPMIRIILGKKIKEEILWEDNSFISYIINSAITETVCSYTYQINKIELISYKEGDAAKIYHLEMAVELINRKILSDRKSQHSLSSNSPEYRSKKMVFFSF